MLLQCHGKNNQISDSERFALKYPLVGTDNIFVYKNADETADILARGRRGGERAQGTTQGRDWDFTADYQLFL
jgi:hypothetical protein